MSPRAAGPDFEALADLHRAELHAHCYRMLGSVQDAEDALQETLLRAWRGVAGLRDTDSARAWLYSIATNVCRTELARRSKRVLPHDFGPAVEGHTVPGVPITESVWLEPYPDEAIGLPAGKASPEASYEQHEAVELAFVAALQHLPANQRATLLLREVLGFSAQETADALATSVASVNSALQRARVAVADRTPPRTQQATARALGDRSLRDLVARYVDAWERCDVPAFASMLAADASFAMPPLSTWYSPRESILTWARNFSLNGEWRWKAIETRANAQPALAFYSWDAAAAAYLPFALNVLSLRDDLVSDVTAFIVRATDATEADAYVRFPDRPMDAGRLGGTFERFDLPSTLTR
jgi:RNA polymerase sigma-70 factor (ECF subfamily)